MEKLEETIVDFVGASNEKIKEIIKKLKDDGHRPEWEDTTRLSSKNPSTIKAMKAMKKQLSKNESVIIDFEGVSKEQLQTVLEKLTDKGHEILWHDEETRMVSSTNEDTIKTLKNLKTQLCKEDMEDIIEDVTLDKLLEEAEAEKQGKKKEDVMDKSDKDKETLDSDEDDDKKKVDEGKKLDKVGDEDGDIDNDGDEDESDEYLKKRRDAIKKNESVYNDDLDALVEGDESLSEDFKEKSKIIFEAALSERIRLETEKLQEEFDNKLIEESAKNREDLEEKVDNYLTYAVESWVEDNKIAVEGGLRTEIAENFISALKDVFVEHYIEVPDTKKDYVSDLETEVSLVKEALCGKEEEAKSLNEKVEKLTREKILAESSESLAATQAARLRSLAEDITFVDEESFAKKLSTIKECYFRANDKTVVEDENDNSSYKTTQTIVEDAEDEDGEIDPTMAQYVKTLGRIQKAQSLNVGQ